MSISASLGSRDGDPKAQYTDIQPCDDLSTIISNISLNNCKSIEETLSVIDRKEIARAVDLLCHSKRIVFFGAGASGLICKDGEQKFMRINKIFHVYIDSHSQLTAATLLGKDDVAIFISNSGVTVEIIDALEIALKNKAKCIAMLTIIDILFAGVASAEYEHVRSCTYTVHIAGYDHDEYAL